MPKHGPKSSGAKKAMLPPGSASPMPSRQNKSSKNPRLSAIPGEIGPQTKGSASSYSTSGGKVVSEGRGHTNRK